MTTNKHMGSSFSDFVAQSDAEFLAAVREGIARNAITPDEDIVRLIAMVEERDAERVMFRHRLIAAECSEKGAYLHRIEGMKAEIALALTRIAEILVCSWWRRFCTYVHYCKLGGHDDRQQPTRM